jgi:hypothetical protein
VLDDLDSLGGTFFFCGKREKEHRKQGTEWFADASLLLPQSSGLNGKHTYIFIKH